MTSTMVVYLIGLIFNAGGFFWLALNHFKHVGKQLSDIEDTLQEVNNRLSHLEGVWEARKEEMRRDGRER